METDKTLFEQLQYAKKAVLWLIDNINGDVDCKGLTYWAGEVERLREEIKKFL